MENIDYLILNFNKIVSSKQPEVTIYNNKFNNCENLRQKYNEAYLRKMREFKNKYGEKELNRIKEQLQE